LKETCQARAEGAGFGGEHHGEEKGSPRGGKREVFLKGGMLKLWEGTALRVEGVALVEKG